MSLLIVIGGLLLAFALAVLRALVVDEARGRMQRRAVESVERTIALLPPELQVEWADEWRAELDAKVAMPLTALLFAHGLRRTAHQLVDAPMPSPAGTKNRSKGIYEQTRALRWPTFLTRRTAASAFLGVLVGIARRAGAHPFVSFFACIYALVGIPLSFFLGALNAALVCTTVCVALICAAVALYQYLEHRLGD